jgi:hypothetical protein
MNRIRTIACAASALLAMFAGDVHAQQVPLLAQSKGDFLGQV